MGDRAIRDRGQNPPCLPDELKDLPLLMSTFRNCRADPMILSSAYRRMRDTFAKAGVPLDTLPAPGDTDPDFN